jgi:hypothetical protein
MGLFWPRGFSGSIYQDDLADSKAMEYEAIAALKRFA